MKVKYVGWSCLVPCTLLMVVERQAPKSMRLLGGNGLLDGSKLLNGSRLSSSLVSDWKLPKLLHFRSLSGAFV